jgi:hypothetical protein
VSPSAIPNPPTLADYDALSEKVGNVEVLVAEPQPLDQNRRRCEKTAGLGERRRAWYREIQDAVLDLSKTFPEGVDDYDVRKLLEFVVELGHLIDRDRDAADPKGEIEIATMRAADVVRRIRRRLLRQHLDDPRSALDFIFGTLMNVSTTDLARILGTSTKTVNSWRQGNPVRQTAKVHRVLTVAQVLTYMRDSMTPHGLVMWFEAERDQLGGRTPLQVFEDDPGANELLVGLARGSRGQLAS